MDVNCETATQLEDLPDELLLLICRYLTKIEILLSFSCLNIRLTKTINEFIEFIDLSTIPSRLINRFQNEIFPQICSKVRSIKIPDDFQRLSLNLDVFHNLESIHFYHLLTSNNLLNVKKITVDLVPVHIQNDIIKLFFSSNQYSNVKTLSLNSFHGLSFSNMELNNHIEIENLTITLKNNVDLFELLYLLSSSIESLNIKIVYNGPFKSLSSTPLKLAKLRYFHLKTMFEDSIKFKQLEKLLVESCSSIEHLSIESLTRDEDYIDGFQWEIFLKKLIYLKRFLCAIRYRFKINEDDEFDQTMRQNKLLNSFSTVFWLEERKWFINSYSTISTLDENCSNLFLKSKVYGKLFLHTIPYPYSSFDATIDITRAKSTIDSNEKRKLYSNVRHLYFDGENIPIKLENLKVILDEFKYIDELKLDRLIIDSSSNVFKKIKFYQLNKLIIESSNNDKDFFDLNVLNLHSMSNLLYIHIPQIYLSNNLQMPPRLETLILTKCRDLQFDFVQQYKYLRVLKLYLNNFDRLLENNGELILNIIITIYKGNQIMEYLHLMCPGVHHKKIELFQKLFNHLQIAHLKASFDGKCLTIQRLTEFFSTTL